MKLNISMARDPGLIFVVRITSNYIHLSKSDVVVLNFRPVDMCRGTWWAKFWGQEGFESLW